MANEYKRRLREAFGHTDDSRTFEEVYGADADRIFEGYEVPERFKKLFEAEKKKNASLGKRLNEAMEMMLHSTDKVIKGKAAQWREAARLSMIKSTGADNYEKLSEHRKKKVSESFEDDFGDYEDDFGLDDDLDAFDDDSTDALSLAGDFDDEGEADWDDGPAMSDDMDLGFGDIGDDQDGFEDDFEGDDFDDAF